MWKWLTLLFLSNDTLFQGLLEPGAESMKIEADEPDAGKEVMTKYFRRGAHRLDP